MGKDLEPLRPRWSALTKTVISLLILALSLYLLFRFNRVLKPLVLAMILAYVLSPLAGLFQNRLGVRRPIATLFTYLILLVTIILLPMLVLPPLVNQVAGLNLDFQHMVTQATAVLEKQYVIAGQVIDVEATVQNAIGSIQSFIQPVFGETLNLIVDIVSSVVWVIFIVVVTFYLIKDGELLQQWLERGVPQLYRSDYIRLRTEISQIWSAFFRGQLVLAAVVAVIFSAIGFVLGLPFALLMGILAGLLEFLPSIGHGIWLVTAALLALFAGSTWMHIPNWAFMLLIIGLHLVYQQFDLNYLIPRIIGRSVHLAPLVVILGIVAGALLGGFLGILIAAPTIASGRVLARYVYANLFDEDPFPGSAAPPLPPPNPRWWRRPAAEDASDLPEQSRGA